MWFTFVLPEEKLLFKEELICLGTKCKLTQCSVNTRPVVIHDNYAAASVLCMLL